MLCKPFLELFTQKPGVIIGYVFGYSLVTRWLRVVTRWELLPLVTCKYIMHWNNLLTSMQAVLTRGSLSTFPTNLYCRPFLTHILWFHGQDTVWPDLLLKAKWNFHISPSYTTSINHFQANYIVRNVLKSIWVSE